MHALAPCRQLTGLLWSCRLIGGCLHPRGRSTLTAVWQSSVKSQAKLLNHQLTFPQSALPTRFVHYHHHRQGQSLFNIRENDQLQLHSQSKLVKATSSLKQLFRTKHTHHPSQLKRRSRKVEKTDLPERYKMEWPKITLFGDSITRRSFDVENGCWASMLAFKVNSFFDVDPRGFEGYNSKWALELMPKLFPKSYLDKVEIFVLFFGHNDSWEMPPLNVPVDQYNSNMRAIVKYLLDQGVARSKIVLITPSWFYLPSFLEYTKSLGMPPVKKELVDCEKYSDIVKRIGADEQLEVVDFFGVTAKYEPLEELFCDGVHFSRTGAKLLYDHLMPVIEKKIEAAFKKPLADLWHAVPFDQHPELVPVMEAWKQTMMEEAAAKK